MKPPDDPHAATETAASQAEMAALRFTLGVVLGGAFWAWVFMHYQLVDEFPMDQFALSNAVVVACLVFVFCLSGMWKRWATMEEWHKTPVAIKLVSPVLLFVLGWGAIVLGHILIMALAILLNCALDSSQPKSYDVRVAEAYVTHPRKAPHEPIVRIEPHLSLPESLAVSWASYRRLTQTGNTRMRFHIKPGRLGFRWISGEEVL